MVGTPRPSETVNPPDDVRSGTDGPPDVVAWSRALIDHLPAVLYIDGRRCRGRRAGDRSAHATTPRRRVVRRCRSVRRPVGSRSPRVEVSQPSAVTLRALSGGRLAALVARQGIQPAGAPDRADRRA